MFLNEICISWWSIKCEIEIAKKEIKRIKDVYKKMKNREDLIFETRMYIISYSLKEEHLLIKVFLLVKVL